MKGKNAAEEPCSVLGTLAVCSAGRVVPVARYIARYSAGGIACPIWDAPSVAVRGVVSASFRLYRAGVVGWRNMYRHYRETKYCSKFTGPD